MSELPPGWVRTSIGAITDQAQQRIPASGERFRYIDIASIDRDRKRIGETQELSGANAPSRARKVVHTDDVLVSMTRPNLNAVAMIPASLDGQIASTGFEVLRPRNNVNPKWLFYLVRSQEFVEAMSGLVQGALYPAVRSNDVRSFVVPVAPLDEQRRILDKLDAILTRVENCRMQLQRIPELLRRFREAVLEAAVSGRLTEEWRERANLQFPPEEDWVSLGSLCSGDRAITYGVIKLGNHLANGVPCLRTSNVRWLRLDIDGMKYIDPHLSAQYSRTVLQGTEVLVNVRGTLGGVLAATPEMRGWNVSREIAVVPVDNERLDARYLALWIASNSRQRLLKRMQKGVAYTGINIADLRSLSVAVPSRAEQSEIVRRVSELFALAERIDKRNRAAVNRIEALCPAFFGQAFRGELLLHEPNCEAATRNGAGDGGTCDRNEVNRSVPLRARTSREPRDLGMARIRSVRRA